MGALEHINVVDRSVDQPEQSGFVHSLASARYRLRPFVTHALTASLWNRQCFPIFWSTNLLSVASFYSVDVPPNFCTGVGNVARTGFLHGYHMTSTIQTLAPHSHYALFGGCLKEPAYSSPFVSTRRSPREVGVARRPLSKWRV